jgi:3-oxoacyl-[acyl-carrier-protein] synthase II
VRGFDPEAWMEPRDVKKYDRFTHFAVAASRQLVRDAQLDLDAIDRDRAGVIIGAGIGGMPLFERTYRAFLEALAQDPARRERALRKIGPYFIPAMIINMASGLVSIELGLRGPNSSTVTACATGNHAIGDAFRLIQHGDADLIVAGGTEAVITPMAVGGFCAMKALSTRNDEPEKASRPFDRGRDGFVIAEGCGLLLLEEAGYAARRGGRVLAEVAGLGMSGDAYHISAPPEDGSGMVRVMRAAIADAGITPDEIDYVNAHGTSTPTGDLVEAAAVQKVFAGHPRGILMSSTKSMTGHLLGAAGGLEAVLTVLAVHRGVAPPTINLEDKEPSIEIDCVAGKARTAPIRAALSNSFGFGGTNATLVFRRA